MGLVATSPSKQSRFDETENKLSISLGSLFGYVSIQENAIIPHISVSNSSITLPLFLSKFVSIQDLLLEYSNVVLQLYSTHTAEKTTIPAHSSHHYSSSSLTTQTVMGVSVHGSEAHSRQSLLQKSALKVRQIAKSVKKNVPTSIQPSNPSNETQPKQLVVSLSVSSLTLRVQLTSSLFGSYNVHSLQMQYSEKTLLLDIQKHELELSRTTLSFTDRVLSSPSLPEITLFMRFPTAPSGSPTLQETQVPSNASVPSMLRAGVSQEVEGTPPSGAKKAALSSNGGTSTAEPEKRLRAVLDVDVLKLDITAKQVNSLFHVVVSVSVGCEN